MMTCQQQEMARRGVASSIMRTGRVYVIKRTKEALRQKLKQRSGSVTFDNSRVHPDWWQDKKNPERHGIRIPVLDADGNQKLDSRNRKQWKREVTDATGWNNPKNCELWRSEWAKECNLHLKQEQQIDHRSYKRQGKIEIPTIHEGADARKIEEKYQSGQAVSAS